MRSNVTAVAVSAWRRVPRAAWLCFLLATVATVGCRRAASPATEREHKELDALYGKDSRLILKAPACSTRVAANTAGWKPAMAGDKPLAFSLPAGFKQDTATHFARGGTRWTTGDLEFDIINGDWKPSSFVQEPSDGCRTVVAGRPVLVIRSLDSAGRLTLTVWPYPVTAAAGTDGTIVEAVSPNTADDGLLWTMATQAVAALNATPPPQ